MNPFVIYFPQFYPTPTNDRAWGHGFTDWSLVANANRHDIWQRRAPRRGFYNGADPAIHEAQIAEMIAARLGGMALYHYWFYSHQELPAFEQTLLRSDYQPRLPWFLIWASEGWSRRWMGDSSSIVSLTNDPSDEQIAAHCRYLLECFAQPSYFRWKGKPLFVWYNLAHFDQPDRLIERYRDCLARHGSEIAVGQFIKNPFDATLASLTDINYLFEPRLFFGFRRTSRGTRTKQIFDLVRKVVGEVSAQKILTLADSLQQNGRTFSVEDYLGYRHGEERNRFVARLPGVKQEVISPGWNNAPRYQARFTALGNLDPQAVIEQVRSAVTQNSTVPPLINAWNEWSEGAAIEPCAYLGTRYIDALMTLDHASNQAAILEST
ncbi:glycoside hydrolase family 99-like domain-containing protein [Povalibacter sp.]|uniref:glycoside hydrolase family 99-like domain-containing protein n=1 Tax=Povalibacter sp. TaxID=1962978 RepID=UPI002F3FDABB